MKITPQEILTQQFKMRGKGFDKEEVTSFLMQVSERLENEILEKDQLKKKVGKLNELLSKYEKKENLLKETLIAAQKFSQELKANAEKEVELMIKEAEIKGEEIVKRAITREQELREEVRNLKFKRQEMENDIINMLDSLKELIESYRKGDEEFDKVEYLRK